MTVPLRVTASVLWALRTLCQSPHPLTLSFRAVTYHYTSMTAQPALYPLTQPALSLAGPEACFCLPGLGFSGGGGTILSGES